MVNVIDYVPGDTLLHRLNPVTKLGIAAAIIIAIFLADTYPMLLGLLVLTFALGAYAHATSKLGFSSSPLRWAPTRMPRPSWSRCSSCLCRWRW